MRTATPLRFAALALLALLVAAPAFAGVVVAKNGTIGTAVHELAGAGRGVRLDRLLRLGQ